MEEDLKSRVNNMELKFKKLSIINRFRIPNYFKTKDVSTGLLEFNSELCVGCKICTFICPAGGLVMDEKNKIPYMETIGNDIRSCMACGDCMSACPKGAIEIKQGYDTKKYFHKLSQMPEFAYPKKY